jgi:Fe-S-cluster containining protein
MEATLTEPRACTRCGKCCTNPHFMGTLSATAADVARWLAERRWDILQWASIMPLGAPGTEPGGADLWVDADHNEARRCPFVRKDRGRPTYRCTIYETRPEVCRDYQPFSGRGNDICEQV